MSDTLWEELDMREEGLGVSDMLWEELYMREEGLGMSVTLRKGLGVSDTY